MSLRRPEVVLFLAALAVRLIHLAEIHAGPLLRYLLIDSEFYDAFGRGLAAGEGFPPGVFFMNVLYGVFLGGVYAIGGEGGRVVSLVVQSVLGAVAVVLTYRIGIELGRARAGMIAALLLTILGPAIFYDAALLTPSLLLFLTTVAVWLAVRSGSEPTVRELIVFGVVLGLLILGRANHALLLLLWAARYVVHGRRGVFRAALLILVAAIVVLPVTARNWQQAGEFIPVTANGGMAMWAGNHDGATGIYSQPAFLTNPVPEKEAEEYRAEASRRAGRELTLGESSGFWVAQTFDRFLTAPRASAVLALRKVWLFFHATESQTNLSYYFAMDQSRTLSIARIHLGWILPFALLGMWWEGRRRFVLLAPVLVAFATSVLFYMSSEYRHPVVPVLLLFAALGGERCWDILRSKSPGRSAALVVVLVALLITSNAKDAFLTRLQSKRVDYLNFGTLAVGTGDFGDAERFFRRSIEIDPNWAVSRTKLADVLRETGDTRGAADQLARAAALEGRPPADERTVAAHELFQAEEFEEASRLFLQIEASTRGEERAHALNNAGLCASRLGDAAAAESLLLVAHEIAPTYPSPTIHLGRMSLAAGDTTAARAWAAKALQLAPKDGRAQRLAARASGVTP